MEVARYLLATRTLGKGGTVESLIKGVPEDVQLLASNYVVELDKKASIDTESGREVSAIPPLLLDGTSPRTTLEDISNTKQASTRPLSAKPNKTPRR